MTMQEQLERVADLVAEAGGISTLWRGELLSRSQERALIARLVAARAEEYAKITAGRPPDRAPGPDQDRHSTGQPGPVIRHRLSLRRPAG